MSNFELLHQNIQKGMIKKLGWKSLTSVQEKTIPEIIDGKNLIVLKSFHLLFLEMFLSGMEMLKKGIKQNS